MNRKSRKVVGKRERVDVSGLRFGVVLGEYHPALGERLLDGALRCFEAHGIPSSSIAVVRVPGAFEVSQAAARLLRRRPRPFDALVCLGVLIRGATSHFDLLAEESCRGIGETARRSGVPLAFGILTVENESQARERTGRGPANKGWEAAGAAIRMAALFRDWGGAGPR
jgi:6,7-dimethyl-8-ribityllumazine synthase